MGILNFRGREIAELDEVRVRYSYRNRLVGKWEYHGAPVKELMMWGEGRRVERALGASRLAGVRRPTLDDWVLWVPIRRYVS